MTEELKELMKRSAGTGFEEMEASDFSAPFLIILQTGSPQLKENHELYIPEARPGRIFNTQSMMLHKECHIVPVRYKFKYVEWKPRNSGGGFVSSYDRSQVPDDLITDEMTGNVTRRNGNLMQPTSYYLVLLVEEGYDRVVIPMYSTQLKKARRWNSMMQAMKDNGETLAIFSNLYKLSVVSEANNKGSWFGWRIEPAGQLQDYSIYKQALDIYNNVKDFLPERLLASTHKTETEEI